VTAAARCASPRQTCDLKISEARARNPESDASTVARKIEGILREIYAQLGEWLRNADGASPMRLAVPAEHAIASPPRHTEPYVETLLNAQILTHIVHHALRSVEPGQGPALAKLWADLKEYTGDESVGISVDQRSLGRLEGWKG
jgi:hypothetical protein